MCSKGSNFKDSRSKRKLDSTEEDEEEKEIKIAFDANVDWEINLESVYSEEEIISIINMLSYHTNVDNGFGRANDESLYRSEKRNDINGTLFDEAMRGLQLERKWKELRVKRTKK